MSPRSWRPSPLAALLLLHAALLAYGAWIHSPSIDEVGHLPSGVCHWRCGRFEPYRVNPPLVRMVAAVPVLLADAGVEESLIDGRPGERPEWPLGQYFLEANGPRAFWLFTLARWACIPFSVLGGYLCYRWARELYGPAAGLLALTLWCFCPNVLANAQMITPDTGAAALGLAAAYAFWHWLRRPDWWRAALTGLVLGLAELTKTTWLLLYLLGPVLWVVWRWPIWRPRADGSHGREVAQLAMIGLLSLEILNLGYGLDGTFRPLGEFTFVSSALDGLDHEGVRGLTGNRFRGTWLERIPVPVPAEYLLGIDLQKHDFEGRMPSYLRGEWRQGGWWYYYLYGLLVKVPLGTWALAGLALFGVLTRRGYAAPWRDELTLLLPPLAVLALVSSQTGFNHHLRYVLPVLPFAFVSIARVCVNSEFGIRKVGAVLAAGASVASSLAVYPHSLSYFNEAVGGPKHGGEHLIDSNLEWGQDFLLLKRWQERHPEARPMRGIFFGSYDPRLTGVELAGRPPAGPPPNWNPSGADDQLGPQPGWYAISVTYLHTDGQQTRAVPAGLSGPLSYGYFRRFRPATWVGYSISIYDLTPEEVDRVRREMGLRPLSPPA